MTADIVEIASRRRGISEYDHFCRARQSLIIAATAWLATNPSPEDIKIEIDGTVGAVSTLADCFAVAPKNV